MKHYLFTCLAVIMANVASLNVQSQEMEQITGELKAGDLILFKEVKTGNVMSNGRQANLVAFDPDATNIQFVVEGNAADGYQFIVEGTSNGVAGDHAAGELYLSGGSNVWDVFIQGYNATNCTWFVSQAEELGIYKIKNILEKGDKYMGVNYGDAGAGYPLWRDKAGFPYAELTDKSAYGIFWNLYRYGLYDYYGLKLNQLYKKATSGDYDEGIVPGGTAQDIARVAQEASDLRDDPNVTTEQLQAKAEELSALLLDGDSAVVAFEKVLTLINIDYNELMELPYALEDQQAFTVAKDKVVEGLSSPEVRRKDVNTMIVEFEAAIRAYRLSGFKIATENSPIGGSWLLTNPDFEAGTINGWTSNGFGIIGTAANYKNMQGVYFAEKFIAAGQGTLSDYSMKQIVPDELPNGKYLVTANIIACNQHSDSTQLADGTGIHGAFLFANSTSKSVGTENGGNKDEEGNMKGGAPFSLEVVVTDHKLTVGFKTESTNANWVAIDNIQLSYLGDASLEDYEKSYNEQLARAKALSSLEMLPVNAEMLNASISVAESSDRSTVEALCEVVNKINTAIDTAEVSIKEMRHFKSGSYKLLSSQEAATEELQEKMAAVLSGCNAILKNDTTTAAAYVRLETELAAYIAFAKAFNSTYAYLIQTEVYTVDALRAFEERLSAVVASLDGFDAFQLEKAYADLAYALVVLRNTASGEGDMTNIWLVNPSFDNSEDGNSASAGWVNVGTITPNTVQVAVDEKFDGIYCMEKWTGYGGNLANISMTQTINSIPNGRYTITLNAKALQQEETLRRKAVKGVYLFANNDSVSISTPMILDKENCVLDPETGDTLTYAYINSVNPPATPEPAAQTFSVSVEVTDHILTLGFATKDATANWISFDRFTLTCDEMYDLVAVREIDANKEWTAYVENGRIKVIGADRFTVTALSGIPVSEYSELVPGVYLVRVDTSTVKVIVK